MTANRPDPSQSRRPRETVSGSLAEQVLAHAQAGREIVQEFRPIADSLN